MEGRLLISDRAHLLFDLHKEIDGAREAELAGALPAQAFVCRIELVPSKLVLWARRSVAKLGGEGGWEAAAKAPSERGLKGEQGPRVRLT